MNNVDILESFIPIMSETDILVVVGRELCIEASKFERKRTLYLDKVPCPFSIAAGLAMSVNSKVFCICEDEALFKNLSDVAQAIVANMKNLFLVVFKSKKRRSSRTLCISMSIPSIKGIFFNMGALIHDYTYYFSNLPQESRITQLRGLFEKNRGSAVIFINSSYYHKDVFGFEGVPLNNINEFSLELLPEEMLGSISSGESIEKEEREA